MCMCICNKLVVQTCAGSNLLTYAWEGEIEVKGLGQYSHFQKKFIFSKTSTKVDVIYQ